MKLRGLGTRAEEGTVAARGSLRVSYTPRGPPPPALSLRRTCSASMEERQPGLVSRVGSCSCTRGTCGGRGHVGADLLLEGVCGWRVQRLCTHARQEGRAGNWGKPWRPQGSSMGWLGKPPWCHLSVVLHTEMLPLTFSPCSLSFPGVRARFTLRSGSSPNFNHLSPIFSYIHFSIINFFHV